MDKASLRREFLQKRRHLAHAEIERKTLFILSGIIEILDSKPFTFIHIFLPQTGKAEIDTWPIISKIRSKFPEIRIVAPYVIPGTKEMEHYLLDDKTILTENKWGIPEPDPETSQKILPEILDAVLIPLLAFDQNGYRVGYGGGFYDRFLTKCRTDATKIGLSFFEPVDTITNTDAFDVKMDICVTPGRLWKW